MKHFLALGTFLAGVCLASAQTPLESAVLTAVRRACFEEVMDFGAGNEAQPVKAHLNIPAHRIAHPPNVDVAVIQLDREGKMVDCADVLYSRDYPHGLIVPLDRDHGAAGVRFRRWDIERSDGGTFSGEDGRQLTTKGWTNDPPLTEADDIVAGRETAPHQFMAPYPASLFKLMVAFHIMRMVDEGTTSLDRKYSYVTSGPNIDTRKIHSWMDAMITASDDYSTAALVKMLHERNEFGALNGDFRNLNLGTLQINGTNPKDGHGWHPGKIHMTAFDVARLLWIIDNGPGVLWHGADGQPVTAHFLSDSSRAYLKEELLEQGWNHCLTTANMPGAPHVRAGIPSRVAARWINPNNGHVMIRDKDYGVDIRELNTHAEVEFAHKSGLTFNYSSDAGIVTSLPGKPFRHYIIVFMANLGYRYVDEVFAARKTFPSNDPVSPIDYTQRIPAMAKEIDEALVKLSTPVK